jgi:hypothetical protein
MNTLRFKDIETWALKKLLKHRQVKYKNLAVLIHEMVTWPEFYLEFLSQEMNNILQQMRIMKYSSHLVHAPCSYQELPTGLIRQVETAMTTSSGHSSWRITSKPQLNPSCTKLPILFS